MNIDHVIEVLGQVPLGKVIVWCLAICSIVVSLYKAVTKLYGLFVKYRNLQNENEAQKSAILAHDKAIDSVIASLDEIKASLNEQKDVNLKQIRYTIVHTCDDAIYAGYITAGKLRSLEELYEEYTCVFHGNGYVKTLVEKTRELPVKGKLSD